MKENGKKFGYFKKDTYASSFAKGWNATMKGSEIALVRLLLICCGTRADELHAFSSVFVKIRLSVAVMCNFF